MSCSCGCCEGVQSITPEPIWNRPGLSAMVYRVGTYGSFFESMQARLSQVELTLADGTTERALASLTTRDPADPAMAVLAGWATVADVLSFYQERIANEGYLRTAIERRSILELGRLVDYTLRPGVASTVYLAYTVDENQVELADVPVASISQSVPGPGEQPQSFETVEHIQAHAKWNLLQPRLRRPQTVESIAATKIIYLAGVALNLRTGDPLLVGDGQGLSLFRVVGVDVEAVAGRTAAHVVEWAVPVSAAEFHARLSPVVQKLKTDLHRAVAEALDALDTSTSRAATRAARVLTQLDITVPAAELAALEATLSEALTGLKEIRASLPASATIVGPWLDAIVVRLSVAHDDVVEVRGTIAAREFGELVGQIEPSGYPEPVATTDDLLQVMRGLSRPPSIPPRNALNLRRDLSAAFQPRSDVGLQIVAAVKPDLKALLPLALANVQATQAVSLQVYALRVKAGVYGATAPGRAIVDDRGRVVATADWPIDGSRRITVRVVAVDRELGEALIVVNSRTSHGTFQSVVLDVKRAASASGTSGDLGVVAQLDADTSKGLHIDFVVPGFKQSLTIIGNVNSGITTLSAASSDGGSLSQVPVTDERIAIASGRRITEMSTEVNRLEQVTLVYATDVPVAPTPLNVIALDATYDVLTPGGLAVVVRDSVNRVVTTQIDSVQTGARNDYNLPSKTTELTLADSWLTATDMYVSDIADTLVFAGSEKLVLADEPVDDPICGADQWIELDGLYNDLKAGRWLIVAGPRADIKDATDSTVPGLESAELVMLADGVHDVSLGRTQPRPGDSNHTFIRLAAQLSFCYARDQVKLYGNVVKATHGETRKETLGAGDGAQTFQTFALKQKPLTFVSAPTAVGATSTLHVFVDNVEWPEVSSFVELGRADRGFVTRTGDDDTIRVTSGDGKTGTRLPTGFENVRAVYRQGIGSVGNVRAKQISLLQSRPLGVKDVINPMRASGGADRESADQARKNVPLGVTALDRLVSVQDYADFAGTFAGIGKAASTRLPFGNRELVHVTIAGADDIPIDSTSDLYRNLLLALRDLGDPGAPVSVDTRELLLITLQAQIGILAGRVWDVVVAAVSERLYTALSFECSELGGSVWLSQVIGTIQAVPGVAHVEVQAFGGIPERTADPGGARRLLTPLEITQAVQEMLRQQANAPAPILSVRLATLEGGAIRPAQLAVLSRAVPATLVLNQVPNA